MNICRKQPRAWRRLSIFGNAAWIVEELVRIHASERQLSKELTAKPRKLRPDLEQRVQELNARVNLLDLALDRF
jgi:hypothetical protein